MIPDSVFRFTNFIRISYLKAFGNGLQKLLIEIADDYYRLLSEGFLHDEIVKNIIKDRYLENPKMIEDCMYFVFSRRQSIDSIFDRKYGMSGRFMSHLFKLIQKIYLDTNLDDNRLSYETEMNTSTVKLNKSFNKVVLYYFDKYDS